MPVFFIYSRSFANDFNSKSLSLAVCLDHDDAALLCIVCLLFVNGKKKIITLFVKILIKH